LKYSRKNGIILSVNEIEINVARVVQTVPQNAGKPGITFARLSFLYKYSIKAIIKRKVKK